MAKQIISIQWVSGDSLYRITDDEENSTVIDSKQMAELMSAVVKEGKSEVLPRYFEKEIQNHLKTL